MKDKHFIRKNDEYGFSKKKTQTIYFCLKLKLHLFPSNQAKVPLYLSCWFMLINCLLLIVLLSNYNINISCLFSHKTFGMWQIRQHMDTKADRWCKKSTRALVSNVPRRRERRRLLKRVRLLSTSDQKAHLFIFSSSRRGSGRTTKSKKEMNLFTFRWPSWTAGGAVNDFLCSAGLYWCSRKMTRVCVIKANIFTAPRVGDKEEDEGGRVNGCRGGCGVWL